MGVPAVSHEIAFATSQKVVQVFAPLLREEEQADAIREVYPLLKDALLLFADRMDRERRRLHGPDAKRLPAGELPTREGE
jgi:hypothetical protein